MIDFGTPSSCNTTQEAKDYIYNQINVFGGVSCFELEEACSHIDRSLARTAYLALKLEGLVCRLYYPTKDEYWLIVPNQVY